MSFRRRFDAFRERFGAPAEDLPLSTEAADGLVRPLLVCGLGNPGPGYNNTRHNVGAWCVQALARRHGTDLRRDGRVDHARIEVDGHVFEVARAREFYNGSGGPLAGLARRLRVRPEHLLVIYDDIDLPVGRTRMRLEGGTGGNNGMKSIIGALGSQQFARIRIGVDRPYDGRTPVRDPDRVAEWVLSPPHPDERRQLDAAVARVVEAVELAAREGLGAAMNWLNRQPDPPAAGEQPAPPDGNTSRS